MKTKRTYLLLILFSYPLALLLALVLSLLDTGLAYLLMNTRWIEVYPLVDRGAATWAFFLSLNLIALVGIFQKPDHP